MSRLADLWGQVWPNLAADLLSGAAVWLKVHAAHKHVLRLHERLDALHDLLGDEEPVPSTFPHPSPKESA